MGFKVETQITNYENQMYMERVFEDGDKYLSSYLYFVFKYILKIVFSLAIKNLFVDIFGICISIHFCDYFCPSLGGCNVHAALYGVT